MPLAERSLEDVIRNERIAGRDLNAIRYFASSIGEALAYLHQDEELVHADLKPLNIVRIGGYWKLIDLDAAVQVSLSFPASLYSAPITSFLNRSFSVIGRARMISSSMS
jgi:serine/threonine protein kinase